MFIVFRFETTGEVLDYMDAALILQETGNLICSFYAVSKLRLLGF